MIKFFRLQMGGRGLLDFIYLFMEVIHINFHINNINRPFINFDHCNYR
jgi:hypothetical protein